MRNFSDLTKSFSRFLSEHSPAIMTGTAVAGVASTAFLTARSAFEASNVLVDNESSVNPLTNKQKAQLTWKLYIPPAVSGVVTVVLIIASDRVSSRRTKALMSMYSIAETALGEYKDKVIETIGANKELKIRDAVAADRVEKNPVSSNQVIVTSGGSVLCYESMTGRYFQSDMESIRKAINDTNARCMNDMYASLNDFYDFVGLPRTDYGEEVGWGVDHMMSAEFTTTLSEDNRPCIVITYPDFPRTRYYKHD